jgi:Uma2 family endonuclease
MASMIAAIGERLTIEQLDALDLPMDNGLRYELIDGELFVSSLPHYGHQFACNEVAVALTVWSRLTDAGRVFPAPGLVLTPEDAVGPDVVWVRRDRLGEVLGDEEHGRLRAAPDLVVEVLSRGTENTRRDRERKLDLYSRHRVREYWIVDWRLKLVDVFRHDGERLRLIVTLTADDRITSPLLPGFSANVGELCAPPA